MSSGARSPALMSMAHHQCLLYCVDQLLAVQLFNPPNNNSFRTVYNIVPQQNQTLRTCGLLPGWYGSTSQDLLTAFRCSNIQISFKASDSKDEAPQTDPVKIGSSS
ncbi:hypothetical protein STEG23_036550 [Scotinomys teguina]